MSLLLDALRRAEQAKQAGGAAPAESSELEALNFESTDVPPADEAPAPPPLITRDRLPDISQSLEILADDLIPPLRMSKDPRMESPRGHTPTEEAAAMQAQSAARRLFEAKEKRAAAVSPFHIAIGVLGLLAVAGAVYVWYQLQPSSPQVSIARTTPPATASESPAVETPAASTVTEPPANAADTETIVPPLMSPTAARQTRTERVEPTVEAPIETPAPKREPSVMTSETTRVKSASGPNFSKSVATGPSLNEQAYAAFERGDYSQAREHYQAALNQDPRNRDALLGLASLDARSGRYESAEARYLKALEADPRDAHAKAGLIALRGQADPVASETRLKNLLADQPEAGFLNFALGNQYAAQNRWPEAQQAYFKAFVAESGNADYAFNLAVALDHLRQPKVAADYYRKALTLSAVRPAAFNRTQAEARLRELSQ